MRSENSTGISPCMEGKSEIPMYTVDWQCVIRRTEDIQEAVRNWEKMRSIAGLKRTEDYMIGVELMSACGREAEAAEIYEQFLETERDEEATVEVHEKLFHIYRRLDDPKKLLDHAVRLLELRPTDAKILTDTVHFLVTENRTDLAAECENKTIIKAICNELLEDKMSQVRKPAGSI